jgi:hypothetical protein
MKMDGFEQPEMYTQQEAAVKDIADVVRQAMVCGAYDAVIFVQEKGLVGREAEKVRDFATKLNSCIYVIDTLGENSPRTVEALRLMGYANDKSTSYKHDSTASRAPEGVAATV